MSVNNKQVGGTHYKTKGVQHWSYCSEANVPYLEGNATKYLTRWRNKNGLQDLEKALHYVEKRLEDHGNHLGVIKGANKKESLFNRFIADNNIPHRERQIIDTILHWKRIDQLYAAHAELKQLIEEVRASDPTRNYVDQDQERK